MKKLSIDVVDSGTVSGLWLASPAPRAALVLAHGAGAGMDHPFMAETAAALAEEGVSTLRFQFPYMEKGRRRPDRPPVAMRTVRAEAKSEAALAVLLAEVDAQLAASGVTRAAP